MVSQTRVQMAERSSTVHLQADDAMSETSRSVCNAFAGLMIDSVDHAAVPDLLNGLPGLAEVADLTSVPNSRAVSDATEEHILTTVTQPDTVSSDIEVPHTPDVTDYAEVPPSAPVPESTNTVLHITAVSESNTVPEITAESGPTLLQDATAVLRSSAQVDTVNNSTSVQDTPGAAVPESKVDQYVSAVPDPTAVPHTTTVPHSAPPPAAKSKPLPPIVIRRVAPRPAPKPLTQLAPDPVPEVYSGWVPRSSSQPRGDNREQFLRNSREMYPLFVMPLNRDVDCPTSMTPAHSLLVPEDLPTIEAPESPRSLSVPEFVREILLMICEYNEE